MGVAYGVIGENRKSSEHETSVFDAEFSDLDFITCVLEEHRPSMDLLVSGGGRGIETLVERWAHNNKIPFRKIPPALSVFADNMPEKGRAINNAFLVRNTEIIQNVSRLVAFWNGSEPLLLAAVTTAIKMKRRVIVYPSPLRSQVNNG